ncbi:MAG: nucleotidyl transferase AbiEii/AbiGii toxin family protein [Candidatus Caldatribacteriaceae bacterium]
MDFRTVFEKVVQDFHDSKIRYALIGGFALGLWGIPRATVDLDFLITKEGYAQGRRGPGKPWL